MTMGAPMVARQERPSSGHPPLCWLSQHSDRCPDGGLSGLAAIEAPVIVLARLGQHDRAISYGPGHTLRGRAAQSLSQAVKNDSPSPECARGLRGWVGVVGSGQQAEDTYYGAESLSHIWNVA